MIDGLPLQQIQMDAHVIAYRESGPLDGQPVM